MTKTVYSPSNSVAENQTVFGNTITVAKSLMDEQIERRKSDALFLLWLAVIATVLLCVVLLNTYVFFNVRVSGRSMQPTLYTGDLLVANRVKELKHGDIVIISGEKANNDWLIKRVIAVGGDTVKIQDGFVFVNGTVLVEDYVKAVGVTRPQVEGLFDSGKEFVIPENHVFYLGDNRTDSSDSRTFGTCTKEQIVGVVEDWSLYLCRTFRKTSSEGLR